MFLDGEEIAQVESQNRCRTQEMVGTRHTSELPVWKDVKKVQKFVPDPHNTSTLLEVSQ